MYLDIGQVAILSMVQLIQSLTIVKSQLLASSGLSTDIFYLLKL